MNKYTYIAFAMILGLLANEPNAYSQESPTAGCEDLRSRLLEQEGDDYIEARGKALRLSEEAFDDLVRQLRQDGSVSPGACIALYLKRRRENPELSARFDDAIQWSLDNPDRSGAGNIHRYQWRQDYFTGPVEQPLILEGIEKNIFPSKFRGYISRGVRYWDPELIDPLLYLSENGLSKGWISNLIQIGKGHPETHDRISRFLVRLYREKLPHRREAEQLDRNGYGEMRGLFELGSMEHYILFEDMFAHERDLITQHGFTPWDPSSYEMDTLPYRIDHGQKRKLVQEHSNKEGATYQRLVKEMNESKQVMNRAIESKKIKHYWDSLNRLRRQFIDKLAKSTKVKPIETDDE